MYAVIADKQLLLPISMWGLYSVLGLSIYREEDYLQVENIQDRLPGFLELTTRQINSRVVGLCLFVKRNSSSR